MGKVTKMLAHVLNRATSDVRVTEAMIVRWPTDGSYFIRVYPVHIEYWMAFKKTYSYWKQVAVKYNVAKFDTPCPEFHTKKDLISWLIDVVSVTEGERKLLKILFGCKC